MPARSRRDPDLSTPTARRRLKPRPNGRPHWRFIAEGRYVGYRRHAGNPSAGTWAARYHLVGTRYAETTLGTSDDRLPADGRTVLSYAQAAEAARRWFREQEHREAGETPAEDEGPYTVETCLAEYMAWYATHRRGAETVAYTVRSRILPDLGAVEVKKLTTRAIRDWQARLATSPALLRTRPGEERKVRPAPASVEELRRRRVTANRVFTILRAALNRAYKEGKAPSAEAWRRVEPFKGVAEPKVRYLDRDEALRLLNACPADFRQIVQAALYTGARYGELTALEVGDYRPEAAAIYLRETKSGKARHVYLTEEGVALFDALTAGRRPAERAFLRADGEPWGRDQQARPMREACKLASIEPRVSFHILRHTHASLYLMAGGSLSALAAQLGHADTRMTTRHYGHLADSWRAEEARRYGPQFGGLNVGPVVRMRRKRR